MGVLGDGRVSQRLGFGRHSSTKSKKTRIPHRRRLETLEKRQLLAGDLSAKSESNLIEVIPSQVSLSFEESTGIKFVDRLNGKSAKTIGVNPLISITGQYGNAVQLTDSDHVVIVESNPQLEQLGANDNDFSLSSHLRPESTQTGTARTILAKANSNFDKAPAVFLVGSDHRIRAQVTTTTGLKFVDSSVGLTLNQWHHIGIVKSGSDFSIFIDGVNRGTTDLGAPTVGNDADLRIGSFLNYSTEPFAIDELQIFNDAVSPEALNYLRARPAGGLVRTSGNVLANDEVPAGTNLTVTVLTSPECGEVVVNQAGDYEFFADHADLVSDAFVYELSDGAGNTSAARVSLNAPTFNFEGGLGAGLANRLDWSIQLPFEGQSDGIIVDDCGIETGQSLPASGVTRVVGKNGNGLQF
ncbi:MAG: LamG-like jellyroll fold domain-containing protein [Planctomycetota bacterium]